MPFKRSDARDFVITPEIRAALAAAFGEDYMSMFSMDDEAVYRFYWDNLKSYAEKDYRDMLHDIIVPALVVYADPGSLYDEETARYLQENIPNAEKVGMENTTHASVMDARPEEFVDIVAGFIRK
jgi:pimeloyl-ACP methyl ester carboxylesterase